MDPSERTGTALAPAPSQRGSSDRDGDAGTLGANTPDIDPKTGEIGRRAITSPDQAHRICESFFNPASQRNQMNGTIAKKYGDEPPFDSAKLDRDGEGWRHNFPTGFLSSFVNRIVPAPMALIDQAKFLTSARLDVEDDPDGKLSEVFQREITTLFRSWNGWRPLCYGIAQEDVLYGYNAAACVDPDEWRCELLRQDRFGVPDGSGQDAESVPMFGIRKDFLIHELYQLIEKKEAAELGGWEWENAVQSINEAMPAFSRTSPTDSREQADLAREAASSGTSHEAGAKVIETYRLFSLEADGKVTQHIVRRTGEPKLLFLKEDQFDSMADVLALFTLEEGNSKFYGSKGVGRKIINMHIAVDRARNRTCDQAYLKSMIWVIGDNGLPTVQFKVRHPIGMIGTDAEINTEILPADLEPFLVLDERLTSYAEAAVGAYLVEKRGEEGDPHETATAAQIRARKEQQQSVAFLQRFFGQFANMVSMMTRRACNADTRDEEAKQCRKKMLAQGLTPELIKKLADRPAIEVIHDLSQTQNDTVVELCTILLKSPFANQKAVWKKLAEAKGNARLADELLLKEEFDPNEVGQQARLQILEISAIRTGESVNVVGTDLHPIHLKVMVGDLSSGVPKIMKNPPEAIPQLLDNANAGVVHGEAHCMAWEAQAKAIEDADALKSIARYREFFEEMDQLLVTMAQQHQQMSAAPSPDQIPPAAGPQGQGIPPGGPQPPSAPAEQGHLGDHLGKISTTISYKDAPPSIKRQIEFHAGFTPAFGASEKNQFQPQWDEDPQTGFPMAPGMRAAQPGATGAPEETPPVLLGPDGSALPPTGSQPQQPPPAEPVIAPVPAENQALTPPPPAVIQ